MNNQYFLYARKSTDVEDKQVLSIEAQLAELRNYAKTENLSIVEEIVEKQSAKSPGRPLFNSMLSRIEAGEANGIIGWHPDRLSRNSVDGGRIIYLLDTGRISTLKFPTFWFKSTPQGKFMLNIAFGQSKYYVDSLAENTKRGLRQKVRRGEFPSCAPIGYINDVRTKSIAVDKKRSVIIRQAFELYARGDSRLEDISTFLAEQGLVARGGKRFHKDRINFILHNPFYYGHFRYLGETYEGKHQPVITKQLFDQVQVILQTRGRPYQTPTYESQALCGLLRCGTCNMMITGEEKTKHQKNGNEHHYVYYHCTKKSKTIRCSERPVAEGELARQLSSLIKQPALSPSWADNMRKQLDIDKQNSAQSVTAFVSETQLTVRAIDQKLQRLIDGYLDQLIDQDIYKVEKNKLVSEKKSLTDQLARMTQTQTGWVEPMLKWINQAENMPVVAECGTLAQVKSAAKEIFGSDLWLSASEASGEYRDPWKFVVDATNRCKKAENLQNSCAWVGPLGFGPRTPYLRGRCSNQLSYRPTMCRGEDLVTDICLLANSSTPAHRRRDCAFQVLFSLTKYDYAKSIIIFCAEERT